MADGMKIGSGYVEITAEDAKLNAVLDGLQGKLESTMQKLSASIARNRLEIKALGPDDGTAAYAASAQQLSAAQDALRAKMATVTAAIGAKITALKAAAAAAAGATTADQALAAANASAATSMMQYARAAMTASIGSRDAGYRMMVISQFADDLQYGLKAVVNQFQQLGQAFGLSVGMASTIQLLAVAINLVFTHMDKLRWLAKQDDPFESLRQSAASYIATLVDGTEAIDAWKNAEKGRSDALKDVRQIHAKGVDEKGASLKKAAEDVGGGDAALDLLLGKFKGQFSPEAENRLKAEISKVYKKAIEGDADSIADIQRRAQGTPLATALFRNDPARLKRVADQEKADKESEKAADRAADKARGLERERLRDQIEETRDRKEAIKEQYDRSKKVPDTQFYSNLDDIQKRIQISVDRPTGEDRLQKQIDLLQQVEKNQKKQIEQFERQERMGALARLG